MCIQGHTKIILWSIDFYCPFCITNNRNNMLFLKGNHAPINSI